MINFSFDNKLYMNKLNHQAIHMDQAITYSPEYRVTRAIRNYPSRVAQVARAIHLGELEASEYSSDMIFSSILSGLGERWQNFGENQNDNTLCTILAREMMVKKGYKEKEVNDLKNTIKSNNNHIIKTSDEALKAWNDKIEVDENSRVYLLLDDASFNYTYDNANDVKNLLNKSSIKVKNNIAPCFVGFEYFASGLVKEGTNRLQEVVNNLQQNDINMVITLSGQSEYALTTLCEAVGIKHKLKVVSILDLIDDINCKKSYVYGGSFYTRLLKQSDKINKLVNNTYEEVVKNSWEFTPLLNADKRVNKVTMWEMPLCAEYNNEFGNQNLEKDIYKKTLEDMSKIQFKNIVVFDPYAYNYLKTNNYDMNKVQYFTSVAN